MTDDAYLVLFDDPAVSLGVPLAAVEDAAFLDTPAVRAWLGAQGVTVTTPGLRLLPPEETSAVPEGAERLPVPLGDEELSRVRQLNAPATSPGWRRSSLPTARARRAARRCSPVPWRPECRRTGSRS